MTVELRSAAPEDARAIAEVHVQAWREAYSHLVPAESMARLSVDQRALRWNEIIAAASSQIWVACERDRIVGWGSSGPARGENPPRDLELEGLYVLASHYGSGAGQALLDAAVSDAPALLWVAEDNPRARAFYTRNGFDPDGADSMHSLAGTPVRAIRMVR
jgi:ribosomal protein S18 acetylase RimI-like enzyme